MLKNYFKTAFRNLVKHKVNTAINIAGLALGLTAFILISAYVHFENSFDRMHNDADNIYRVESSFYKGNELTDDWATSTNGYAPAMQKQFPEINSFTRINWNNAERIVRYNDIKFREQHVCFADSNFFSFFSFPLVSGRSGDVLKDANTVVVSQSAAKKYFGNENPVGKFLDISTISDHYRCMVTGVFKDMPANSTLQSNFLISWSTSPQWTRDFWYIHESYTFVKLTPGVNPAAVETKFPALAEQYKSGPALKELKWAIKLVPLKNIHLNPPKQYGIEVKGDRRTVGFLAIIAFVILIIACINYINLSTARAIERAKEIGVRKVSGASRQQLIVQLMLESFLVNAIALMVAILLVVIAGIYTQRLPAIGTSYGMLFDQTLYLRLASIFIINILLSGIYPAFILTAIKPVAVLKGKYAFSKQGNYLRKGLVGFQFAASILLITGAIAVYRQLSFMNAQQLGVNISQTLVMRSPVNTDNYQQKIQSLKNALLRLPSVSGVTGSGAVPGKEVGKFLANRRYGASTTEERTYEMLKVDFDFMKMYGLQLAAGREFDEKRVADSTGIILNESAVQQFGFASNEKAIGEKIWIEANRGKPNEIIGVIKDYHQQSLQQKYTPFILFMDPDYEWIPTDYYSVKINTADMKTAVAEVQKVWNGIFPESSFDFFFLDEFYNRQYLQERSFGNIFLLFTSLAIIIACMGLFGLTAYSVTRRMKEIGVRKVLGASVLRIISLLTMDVLKLVIGGSVIAFPVALFFIKKWLQGYAFRAALSWWQFVLPVIILLCIALLTIGWLTLKAAIANPVKALRTE